MNPKQQQQQQQQQNQLVYYNHDVAYALIVGEDRNNCPAKHNCVSQPPILSPLPSSFSSSTTSPPSVASSSKLSSSKSSSSSSMMMFPVSPLSSPSTTRKTMTPSSSSSSSSGAKIPVVCNLSVEISNFHYDLSNLLSDEQLLQILDCDNRDDNDEDEENEKNSDDHDNFQFSTSQQENTVIECIFYPSPEEIEMIPDVDYEQLFCGQEKTTTGNKYNSSSTKRSMNRSASQKRAAYRRLHLQDDQQCDDEKISPNMMMTSSLAEEEFSCGASVGTLPTCDDSAMFASSFDERYMHNLDERRGNNCSYFFSPSSSSSVHFNAEEDCATSSYVYDDHDEYMDCKMPAVQYPLLSPSLTTNHRPRQQQPNHIFVAANHILEHQSI